MKRIILIASFVLMTIVLMTSFAFADTEYSLQVVSEDGMYGNHEFYIAKDEPLTLTLWKCKETDEWPEKIEIIKYDKDDFEIINSAGKKVKNSVFTLKQ